MAHHDLKQFHGFFQPIVDGDQRAIVRNNDRKYKVGDTITLNEGCLKNGEFEYSGRDISAEVSHISDFALQEGYVCLSLKRVGMLIIK